MDDRYKIDMWDGEIPDPMVHPYDRACNDVRTRHFEHDSSFVLGDEDTIQRGGSIDMLLTTPIPEPKATASGISKSI